MKLYRNGEVMLTEIKLANTFIKRLRGYMFYKKPPVEAIAITPCNAIHTFFMRFKIDVLFLDSEMMVIKKLKALDKNKIISPVKGAKYVLETRENGFDTVRVGDVLSIC